jgi:ABC-type antimicrobial peptide transport system permease subunit
MSGIGVRDTRRQYPPDRSGLRAADVARLAVAGLRGKPVRAVLSALGVALGVATIVAVLGLSASSRAQLVAEIDSLGTNMLTAQPSQLLGAQDASLPATAPAMAARIGPVISVGAIGAVSASIYKNDRIPAADTEAISVDAASPGLLGAVEGHLYCGRFLNAATSRYAAVVLGADAASALGIDQPGTQAWLDGQWFTVVGIMQPAPLAPELDRTALIGFTQAARLVGQLVLPTELYVRTYPQSTNSVGSVLAATVDPASPQDVTVTNPADALIARADASSAFNGLFLALGAVALAVGGIGIANVMVIAVLERRSEIGLRRALGARRVHVGLQFLAESSLLALTGGGAGAILGGFATTVFAAARHWDAVVPFAALLLATGSRAARSSPAEGLRTV